MADKQSPPKSAAQKPKNKRKPTKSKTTKKPLQKKRKKKNKKIKVVPVNVKTSLKVEREASILKLVVKKSTPKKTSNGKELSNVLYIWYVPDFSMK